jgi:hypothetical protein
VVDILDINKEQSTIQAQVPKGSQGQEENYQYKLTSEEKEACLLVWNLLAWSRASSMKPPICIFYSDRTKFCY